MLTPQQLEERRRYLGASDSPAIIGVDPYRSPVDVYLSKVNALDDVSSPKAEAGSRLEPVLLDYAAEYLGRPILDRGTMHTRGLLACNLDGRFSETELVECKTTGLVDGWGDDESDEIPDKVLVQVHHQFYVTGAAVCWVPVILARFGLSFRMFKVERNEQLCEIVAAKGVEFMERHVLARKPPTGIPSLEVLKRIRREPGKWADVPDDLVAAWTEAKDAEKAANKGREEAQAALLAALGDAEGGRCGLGDVTYMEQERKSYTVAATKFRTLRLKAKK